MNLALFRLFVLLAALGAGGVTGLRAEGPPFYQHGEQPTQATQTATGPATIRVDASRKPGVIKPLHGVNFFSPDLRAALQPLMHTKVQLGKGQSVSVQFSDGGTTLSSTSPAPLRRSAPVN
jgi:hypothetical protein